jgi:tetratricopeptide (TPR) repeat protein
MDHHKTIRSGSKARVRVAWAALMLTFIFSVLGAVSFRDEIGDAIRAHSYEVLLKDAMAAEQRGDDNEAERIFEQLVVRYPGREEALVTFAAHCQRRGLVEKADSLYARAVASGRQRFNAVSRYAYFLDSQGKPEEAIAMCRAYLEQFPDDAWANYDLGLHLLWNRQPEASIPHLLSASKHAPLTTQAKTKLGAAYTQVGRHREAIETWGQVVHRDEALKNRQLLYDIGVAHQALDERNEAAAAWQRHLACFPRSLWTAQALRKAYETMGDGAAASRFSVLVRGLEPPLVLERPAARFVQVRGVSAIGDTATAGATLLIQVWFLFLDTQPQELAPEVRFSLAGTGQDEDAACVPLANTPDRIGGAPFWRGDCVEQPFAVVLPKALDAGAYEIRLAVGPDFTPEVALGAIHIDVAAATEAPNL